MRPLAVLFALLVGCTAVYETALVPENVSTDLNASYAAWQTAKITDYRYRYDSSVPLTGGGPPIHIWVQNSVVVDARYSDSGRIWTGDDWLQVRAGTNVNIDFDSSPSVDDLFQIMINCVSECRVWSELFHPTLGYPLRANVGSDIEDSGFYFEISNFKYVPGDGT